MSTQAAFAAALLDPACPAPGGLRAWNGSDPALRYAIHRNNVAVSLVNALQDTFPVCCARIGVAVFRELALRFVRSAPPRSPLLAAYGADFPAFIAQSDLVRIRPELADLAQLELFRVQACHAADAEPLSVTALAAVLAQPEQLPDLRFALHPSVRTIVSRHAIVSIWAAHQELIAFDEVDTSTAQSALIARPGLEVEVLHVPASFVEFLQQLGAGVPLGRAAVDAATTDANFDLSTNLATLIRQRLLTAVITPAEDSR